MLKIGVQTQNVIYDENPFEGFALLKKSGFDCCDFSLNSYLKNKDIYKMRLNSFFDKTETELIDFFSMHKKAAEENKIKINQMHMPYPIFVPDGSDDINNYLRKVVAVKSLKICSYFNCKNIVVHGFKTRSSVISEEAEWDETEKFICEIAPIAKESGIVICVENLYGSNSGHIIEGPCCNARKAAGRIDRVNDRFSAEVLGFCMDTGHANLLGINFEEFIVTLGNRLKVLHIHDNDGIKDLHQIPFTFTKVRENSCCTDWDGFISGLKKIAFNGVLSFETAPVLTSFPQELKSQALKFIADIGKYFSNKINTV